MSLEDGRRRFTQAVAILADEKGRIKDRLLIAYASQLSLLNANQDLSHDLLDDYLMLRYALSDADVPYGYGERAAKKLEQMSEDEASELAKRIFSIFLSLEGRVQHQIAN
ncbi:MAG TPA: hypothetical protein VGJ26_19700 [Pirellulales bacterium]|jgi:hypothetical protein